MANDRPLHQLEELVRAAEAHARLEHDVALGLAWVYQVDGIFRAEAG
jgi:hypothetical protein